MFAVKTRPLSNNPKAPAAPDHEAAAPGTPLQRSLSHPSGGSTVDDVLACDRNALKLGDDAAPLAAACHRALAVLGSPAKRSARARKFAEMDGCYKKSSPVSGRFSLDEPKLRRTHSKPYIAAPPR